MKKTLLLLSMLLLLAGEALATTPNVKVSVQSKLSGIPLEVEVSATRGMQMEVLVDGTIVGRTVVKRGTATLKLEDVRLEPGAHTLVMRSGSLSVEEEFHLISGWLSIIPPVLAIALALISKDVLISLFLGIFSGAFILASWDPFVAFARSVDQFVVPAVVDTGHASIIVFTVFLGGMVGVITKSGGTHGIVEYLKPYATSGRRGQLATWFMGVMVFFDDYANTLIVGPTMRPITDKLKISREKLAYIVDSTAAPVVCLFPISTWVGFEIGLIGDAFETHEIPYDAYSTFVLSIPYRFYPIFALALVLILALRNRDFGPMKAAQDRAAAGEVLAKDARPIADYASHEVEPPEDIPKRAINAILPILTVVIVTVYGLYATGSEGAVHVEGQSFGAWLKNILASDTTDSYKALLWGSLSGMIMGIALPVGQGLLKIRDAMEGTVAGCKAMFMALMVLTLAWSLSAVCDSLDTAQYLVALASGNVAVELLPALTFVMSAAIAFATGSSWGTMGIVTPLVVPICHTLALDSGLAVGDPTYNTVLLGSIASVLTGSVWGDHCSPISDTTILSSMATGCDHIAHVRTQLPYALPTGLLAIGLGSIPVAYGLPNWAALILGIGVLVTVVHVLASRQEAAESNTTESEAV